MGDIAAGGVRLEPGARFTLTNRPVPGDSREASIAYPDLPKSVRPGDKLLLAVGDIELEAVDSYRLELENVSDAIRGESELLLGRDDAVGQARTLEAA